MALISLHAPLRTRLTAWRHAAQWLAPALLAALLAATGCAGESTPDAAATEQGRPDWLQARIEAIEAIYNLTPEGERFLEEHDLRWMRGEPGWFGSFGYDGWTGVGESRLGPIMHELGHAYWGAFGVSGLPDLSWAEPLGGHESSAILQLHADLQTFMAQPPDPYEPLRERLRNLPKTKLGDESGLLHFGEADLVHTTGGNALLLPPILRRYFDAYLTDGEFDSWYAALEWYQGLSQRDARLTAVYFGLEHLDIDLYRDLKPAGDTSLPEGFAEIAEREERQRLVDFALQFDEVTGLEEVRGRRTTLELPFLRGYLNDKLALHRRYPGVLAAVADAAPAAADLELVLAAFAELDGKQANERADLLGPRMEEPIFSVFWPLVDGPTLMELHARGITPRDADTADRTTDGEIERLARIADATASILRRARDDLDVGVRDLEALLGDVLEGNGGEAGMVIELALAADRELAEAVVVRLDHDLVRELLAEEPGVVRQLLAPERLLPILGITAEADADELARGIRDLIQAQFRQLSHRPAVPVDRVRAGCRAGPVQPGRGAGHRARLRPVHGGHAQGAPARDGRHPGLRPGASCGAHSRNQRLRPDAPRPDTRHRVRGAAAGRPAGRPAGFDEPRGGSRGAGAVRLRLAPQGGAAVVERLAGERRRLHPGTGRSAGRPPGGGVDGRGHRGLRGVRGGRDCAPGLPGGVRGHA